MSEEQENKWREKFRIFFFKGSEFWHNSNTAISIEKYSEPYKHGVQGYIEARKKAQEEIDEMTKDRDRIHAHRAKLIEEITQLKEELKREREAVDIISIIHSNDDVGLDRASAMLIVAEETQKQRRIKL